MTKKELIQKLKVFDDDALIMVEGENCPVEVTTIDDGAQAGNGKIQRLIILSADEEDEDW